MRASQFLFLSVVAFTIGLFGTIRGNKNVALSGNLNTVKLAPTSLVNATVSAQPISKVTPSPTGLELPPTLPGERGYKVPILLYHYISLNPNKDDVTRSGLSTRPAIFDQQLQLLRAQGFTTITFDDLAAVFDGKGGLPPKPVILTFDDGYADFYTNAYPILRKYNMKVVVFIPTGLIGGGNYMTWGQIEEIARSGVAVFEAHSVHHYAMTRVSVATLKNELEDSKRVLEQHVHYPVNWFAYPYGAFNTVVVNSLKQAGYIGAVTTLPGIWQYKSRFFYMPRYRAGTRLGNNLLKLLE